MAILEQMQAGKPALIKKDGGEMLIAIVLDRPLAEAKAVKKRRAQICGQIKRLIKFLQDYASRRVRQTRTSNISAERKSRT